MGEAGRHLFFFSRVAFWSILVLVLARIILSHQEGRCDVYKGPRSERCVSRQGIRSGTGGFGASLCETCGITDGMEAFGMIDL